MANKSRILYLLRYLQENSDEDHPVTTAEIRKALASKGCPVTIETLRNDIVMLQETGFDIAVNETSGLSTTYSFLDRLLDVPELQILIDAVSSSQFLTQAKSRHLIDKLIAMAGPSHRAELQPGIMVSEHVKAPNEQLLYIVQAIREGIRTRRKIAFQYFHYNMNKEREPRLNGKIYVVSPYATIWKNDRYFLVDTLRSGIVPRCSGWIGWGCPRCLRNPANRSRRISTSVIILTKSSICMMTAKKRM